MKLYAKAMTVVIWNENLALIESRWHFTTSGPKQREVCFISKNNMGTTFYEEKLNKTPQTFLMFMPINNYKGHLHPVSNRLNNETDSIYLETMF